MTRNNQAEWVSGLLRSKFFGSCVDHKELRKNEKNQFCIDCNLCFCKHCVTSSTDHSLHRLLKIWKYVYHDVVRLQDIQKHLDCSHIQAYTINGKKAVHLNPRPQLKDAKNSKGKGGGTTCEACGRNIQDFPNRFCSIACKVSIYPEMEINRRHEIMCTPRSEVDQHLPNLEAEENSSGNGYVSSQTLTESSEVIQGSVSPSFRPEKRRRKSSFPRRAPLW